MSRIGRKPIEVPTGVDFTVDGQEVTVKGPKGTLQHLVASPITVNKAESGAWEVVRPDDENRNRQLHGLTRTLLANMVEGVTAGYTKRMEIRGVGYRVVAKGSNLEFSLGYSHPVVKEPPAGITFTVESPTRFQVTGIDKQQVGEVAAQIKKIRKIDPYKGKGVLIEGETIRRKVGKAGK